MEKKEKHFPTFKDFVEINDWWRLKICRKHRNPKWLKIVYYPFFLVVVGMLWLSLFGILAAIESSKRTAYRTDPNYKKVIKEGVFFTTYEYHEK